MKSRIKRSLVWIIGVFLSLLVLTITTLLLMERQASNVMHPALDTLARISLADRWSHPELLKIRELGPKAVPDLRRVLREKGSRRTEFLSWLQARWPGATNYISNFPQPGTMDERRWTACQVIQTLGPAARPAAPDLIEIFTSGNIGDWNAASMALWAIGIDAEISERLSDLMARGRVPDNAQSQVIYMLQAVKPPSSKTLHILAAALSHPAPWVQQAAATVIEGHGISTPEILSALHQLQSTATNNTTFLSLASVLWTLEKNKDTVLPPTFKTLEAELSQYQRPDHHGTHGGQGIDATEQSFMKAGALFSKMPLTADEKAIALDLMQRFCDFSDRIFVRMLLLPSMMELGLPSEKGLVVCRTGLDYTEDYYRIQAARLYAGIAAKHPVPELDPATLLLDPFIGVRVYAAKAHWLKSQKDVTPILIDALNRTKHQSYYYPEILNVALDLLGEIGPPAQAAASELEKLTTDPDPAVAKKATEALQKINPSRP